jgi:hypothetical protein
MLVIDVGGTNVKILVAGKHEPRKVPSGPGMTASGLVAAVQQLPPIGPMMSPRWDIQERCSAAVMHRS